MVCKTQLYYGKLRGRVLSYYAILYKMKKQYFNVSRRTYIIKVLLKFLVTKENY